MHIHILAISGQFTTPLAIALHQQGHVVTGSDQDKIYPPASTDLHRAGIPLNLTPINRHINLVIVGSAYKKHPQTLLEYSQAQDLGLPLISATDYISQNISRQNSIVVAGAYGKSTITALIAWILLKSNYQPSYIFGAKPINIIPQAQIANSQWSVLEGDESINGLDTKAKFLSYPTKYVILTSADWEHKESYPTAADNFLAFKSLVAQIPTDGLLIYNQHSASNLELLPFCQAPAIPYDNITLPHQLLGHYNQENVLAAYTLCTQIGLPHHQVAPAIASFKGIKRRLQLLKTVSNIMFIDDFAQSPTRIAAAISALHHQFPQKRIMVYFEPHASFLQYLTSLKGLGQAFFPASQVVISRLSFSLKVDKNQRSTAANYQQEIGAKCLYLPLNPEIVSYFTNQLKSDDILIHFSSGGLEGLRTLHKIITAFS